MLCNTDMLVQYGGIYITEAEVWEGSSAPPKLPPGATWQTCANKQSQDMISGVCTPDRSIAVGSLVCNYLQIAYQWLEFHWWRSRCAWVHQLYGRFEFVLVAMGSGMRSKCIFNDLNIVIQQKTNYTLHSHARMPSIVCSAAPSCPFSQWVMEQLLKR